MHILITGGTGLIGHKLCTRFVDCGYDVTVLSRQPDTVSGRCGSAVHAVGALQEIDPKKPVDAIVNLAGAPIADRRWSAARKQLLLQSRLQVTRDVAGFIAASDNPPRILISASAVGYYGAAGSRELDEDSPPANEYQHQLCRQWEEAALAAQSAGTRVCIIRIGIVLADNGGALAKMLPAFRLGLGGAMGHGGQQMSWIHREDLLRAIEFLLQHDQLHGVFNATAPTPVSNAVFARSLGRVLRRPALIPVPAIVLRSALGEMSRLLLTGQHVLPRRLREAGFEFQFPQLDAALEDLLS